MIPSVLRQRGKLFLQTYFVDLASVLQRYSLIFGCFTTLQVEDYTGFANSGVSRVKSAIDKEPYVLPNSRESQRKICANTFVRYVIRESEYYGEKLAFVDSRD